MHCAFHHGITLRCASHQGVELRGVHHTAEYESTVTKCLFWSEVLQMLFLCERYYYENNTASHELVKKSFLLQKVFEKMESKDTSNMKTWKTRTYSNYSSLTRRCASHHRVKLHGVHPTVESSDQNFSKSSMACIPLRSQTAHHRVTIKIFVSLWLLLTGHSGAILFGINSSKEKNWRKKLIC